MERETLPVLQPALTRRLAVGAALLAVLALTALLPGAGAALWLRAVQLVLTLPVFYMERPLLCRAWQGLAARRLAGELPAVLAALLLLCMGAAYGGWYFFAAAAVPVAATAGECLAALLSARLALRPQPLPAEPVAVGESFVVGAGAVVPVDGIVKQGLSTVEESLLTGVAEPVDKLPGSTVCAGTVNGSGPLTCQAVRTGPDTVSAVLLRRFQAAAAEARDTQTAAVQPLTQTLVLVSLCLAVLTAVVWLLLGADPQVAYGHAAAVLAVGCPGALALAASSVAAAALGCGAKNGISYKNTTALAAAGKLTTLLVDQVGAVTTGEPSVATIQGVGNVPEKFLLSLAAGLEQNSDHPLARAVLARAQSEGIRCATVNDFTARPGQGVSGLVAGKQAAGGSAAFVAEYCKMPAPLLAAGEEMQENGMTPLYFSLAGHLAGIVGVSEAIRASAKTGVAQLKELGVRVKLVSAEPDAAAQHIAALIGLAAQDVTAGAQPGEALTAPNTIRLGGCGAGFVIGAAQGFAETAMEADVALLRSDLTDAAAAVRLARAAAGMSRQTQRALLCYHAVALPLAALLLPPALAALLALAGACLCGNALRLTRLDPRDAAQDGQAVPPQRMLQEGEDTAMPKNTTMQRKRWVFSGRVQGVGFRYRAQYAAKGLELTGWVENNFDGTVTLEAQGPADALDKLVPTITATSQWIMIEEFKEQTVPPDPAERSFRVRGY